MNTKLFVVGLVGAGAAAVAGAVDTTGDNVALLGSDALLDVTRDVMAACTTQLFGDFPSHGLSYLGGGPFVAGEQMGANAQQIGPMSRSLRSSDYCGAAPPAAPDLTESLLLGIDSVALVGNSTTTCSATTPNNLGTGASLTVTSDGRSGGGPPATCPGCDGSGTYTVTDSFDALNLLYFGLTHDGTYDCGGPVRRTLIRNWHNLFSTDCPAGDASCTGGLTHAWRMADLAASTDTLVSILNPPGRGIGTLSLVPLASQSKKTNPFCNSQDANATTTTKTFGGAADYTDRDPVRTPCTPQDTVCEGFPNFGNTGTFVGDLGVVLSILIPDLPMPTTDLYPTKPCGTACTFVTPLRASQIPSNFRCPGGSVPIGAMCLMPFAGPASAPDPRCIAARTTKCIDIIGKADGRQYNLAVVLSADQIPAVSRGTAPFQIAIDRQKRFQQMAGAYRIHSIQGAANNVPDPTVGQTGVCRQLDSASQVGCLVDADPCSLGYGSRAAARAFPGLPVGDPAAITPQPAPQKALSINGTPPFTPGDDPDLAIENLLQPAGTLPLYPLSQRQYLTTLFGFGALMGGESELARCFATNAIVQPVMVARGFVAPPGGVQCLDYPQEAPTATPPPNIQGPGNVALAGCAAAAESDACQAAPIPIQ